MFAIAIIVFVAWLGYESIKYSLRLDIIFVAFEVVVMAGLLIYIVLKGGAEGQSPQSFTPSLSPGPAATTPLSGVWLAFIFILFAFFGFESSTTVAEECENPRRNIPIALLGSVGLTGLWFIFALYAVVVGFGPSHMAALAADPVPLDTLARRFLGDYYAAFIDLAAVMANVAVLIAIHNANFRIFYAMGREGVLPKWLGKTHRIHMTPYTAIIGFSIFAAILALATGLLWGPQAAFGNNGFFSSLGILPIFIVTNLLLIYFMWTKYRGEFSWWRHGLLPAAGAVTFIAALWFSVVPLPAAPLSYFPFIIAGWVVIGLVVMFFIQARDPRRLDVIGKTMFIDAEAEYEAEVAGSRSSDETETRHGANSSALARGAAGLPPAPAEGRAHRGDDLPRSSWGHPGRCQQGDRHGSSARQGRARHGRRIRHRTGLRGVVRRGGRQGRRRGHQRRRRGARRGRHP